MKGELTKAEKIILYGFGRIGREIKCVLQKHNVNNIIIWDKGADLIDKSYNVEVPDFDYPNKNDMIIICLFSQNAYDSVKQELSQKGFTNIRNYKDLELICEEIGGFNKTKCNKCVITRGGCQEYLDYIAGERKSNYRITTISIAPTFVCSLKCHGCVQHTTEIRGKSVNADIQDFINSLKKLVNVIGYIQQVTISGGEIFLYKHWRKLIKYCCENQEIGIVNILTNGVFFINDADLSILKNKKIVISFDNYGEKIPEKKRKIFQDNFQKIKNAGINYAVIDNSNANWYDFGHFEKRKRTVEELKKIFFECVYGNCYVIYPDCYFSICGRQSIAKIVNGLQVEEEGTVNLLMISEKELKKILSSWDKIEYLKICDYCNGIGQCIPSGIQVEEN